MAFFVAGRAPVQGMGHSRPPGRTRSACGVAAVEYIATPHAVRRRAAGLQPPQPADASSPHPPDHPRAAPPGPSAELVRCPGQPGAAHRPARPADAARAPGGLHRHPRLPRELGAEYFRLFRELCGLRPDERILDVGSGAGRCAVALRDYLTGEGTYEGLDVSPELVAWCRKYITPRYPRFRFQVA